ncbi:MAG: quinolinate synthetase [Chloroflexi bacterium RBG_13_56_8]|nr:MAG: quinolinate synthetase [Chloroflexi bacterium RBG_13_56_8]
MSQAEVEAEIKRAKEELGESLVILGHHYQRDEVIQFADYRGDSLELSRRAAEATRARYIVFCGVDFMAETAAILCQPDQVVIQPVLEALCPMANLANSTDVSYAWEKLSALWDGDLVPLTYQNSMADIKAFVGRHDGAVCTSSNAEELVQWGLRRRGHLLFIPDEHLGTNTALSLGIPLHEIGVWDPANPPDPPTLAHCRVVVWKGFCYVHARFTPDQVDEARHKYPGAIVAVHSECVREVVAKADVAGSTTSIIRAVEDAPPGATIVVGTEWHLVNRLGNEFPDKTVVPLGRSLCATMGMTTMQHLLYALDGIRDGRPHNVVTVDADVAKWAKVALEKMLTVD